MITKKPIITTRKVIANPLCKSTFAGKSCPHLDEHTRSWNQWLAGFIDGDGYFYINKKNQAYFEITTSLDDSILLQRIKQKLGGRLTLRSGAKAIRLRIGARESVLQLLHRINGEIRHDVRISQFKQLCDHFNIPFKTATPLTKCNSYSVGLFDADGSITLGVSKTTPSASVAPGSYGKYLRLKYSRSHHQLSLHIVSKNRDLLEQVSNALNFGTVIIEKPNLNTTRPNTLYRWYFRSNDDVQRWLTYLRNVCPSRSNKHKRILMCDRYFDLKRKKVHLALLDSIDHKIWDQFCRKWHNIHD